MLDLELYKPKQEILVLEDEVIELWYGSFSLKFVRLIEKCTLEFNSYGDYILYKLNGNVTCSFSINSNEFAVEWGCIEYLLGVNHASIYELQPYIKILTPVINDLFNYKITGVL